MTEPTEPKYSAIIAALLAGDARHEAERRAKEQAARAALIKRLGLEGSVGFDDASPEFREIWEYHLIGKEWAKGQKEFRKVNPVGRPRKHRSVDLQRVWKIDEWKQRIIADESMSFYSLDEIPDAAIYRRVHGQTPLFPSSITLESLKISVSKGRKEQRDMRNESKSPQIAKRQRDNKG